MSDKIKCLNEEQLKDLDKIIAEIRTGVPYPLQRVLDAVGDYEEIGKYKYKASCAMPEHPDYHPSMDIGYDATTKKVLLKCWSCGAKYEDLLPAMGLTPADLQIPILKGCQEVECYHDYRDEHGELLYQRVRYKNPKEFKCRRPNPDPNSTDKWIWNLNSVKRVLYRLPELLSAKTPRVYITEGEKDVETLREHDLIATTSGGAKTWRSEFNRHFKGRRVLIIPDNDSPGRSYAKRIARELFGTAQSVKIVNIPFGTDVTDFFQLGGTPFHLKALVQETPKLEETPVAHDYGTVDGPLIEAIEPAKWLWPSRIPADSITLLAGKGGLGKSLLSLDLTARITTGSEWPDGNGKAPCGSVLIFTVENTRATTIRRLSVAGAVRSKVHQIGSVFTIGEIISRAEKILETCDDVRLIILDPITQFLGRTDSHKNAEVLGMLGPLNGFAEKHEIAVLGISHYSKAEKTFADDKIIGSIGFTTFARQVWHVMEDGEDSDRVLFVAGKSNLARACTGLAFHRQSTVIEGCDTVKISFEPGDVLETADMVLRRLNYVPRKSDLAKDFLERELADGPKEKKEIERLASEEGITPSTLRKAKENLEVKWKQTGKDKTRKSMWSLP